MKATQDNLINYNNKNIELICQNMNQMYKHFIEEVKQLDHDEKNMAMG